MTNAKHFSDLCYTVYNDFTITFPVDQLDKAIECAVTFMLLNPESKHMKSNIEYYQNNGISTANANPRKVNVFESFFDYLALAEGL